MNETRKAPAPIVATYRFEGDSTLWERYKKLAVALYREEITPQEAERSIRILTRNSCEDVGNCLLWYARNEEQIKRLGEVIGSGQDYGIMKIEKYSDGRYFITFQVDNNDRWEHYPCLLAPEGWKP